MKIHILIIEDDISISHTAKAFLEREGFEVDLCKDGEEGLTQFFNQSYQLVLLDIMLPGRNGIEVLQEIRKVSDVPVLMMTALDDETSQLSAFSYQADDYITKPFYMNVLVKHVQAVLRRFGLLKPFLSIGVDLFLYPDSKRALYRKRDLKLTPKEFDLLWMLAQAKGRIVTREQLIIRLWGYDFVGNERVIDTHMKNLRNKLPFPMIQTVKGIGYRLEEET